LFVGEHWSCRLRGVRLEEEEEEDQTKLSYTDSSVLNPIDGMGLVKV